MGGYLSEDTKREKECYDEEDEGGARRGFVQWVLHLQSWNDVDDGNTHENVFNGSLITKLNTASGRMRSAYKEVLREEPSWTSCHRKFVGTTDYIFLRRERGEGESAQNSQCSASGITICTKRKLYPIESTQAII